MNKLKFIFSLWSILIFATVTRAQIDKLALTEINFLVDGQDVDSSSFGDVTVELRFSENMDQAIDPIVKFGLGETYELNLPEGEGWINATLWQGFFTISKNNPITGDGQYNFRVAGAKSESGVEMDTTLSISLEKSLFICRYGAILTPTSSLDFGTLNVWGAKTLLLTLTNESCADLAIDSITLIRPDVFSVTPAVPFTIAGGASRTLNIRFTPGARTNYTDTMVINSSDPDNPELNVNLQGNGKGAQMVVSPDSEVNFGKVAFGTDSTRLVLVHNIPANEASLSDTLVINNVTTNDEIYNVSIKTFKVAPGDTVGIPVTFTPANNIAYNNRILTIYSNDLTQQTRTFVLNGDGRDDRPPAQIASVSAPWGEGPATFGGRTLDICWQNPNDPTGIRAIWYYFTQAENAPGNEPDTSATETSVGGRYALELNGNCASLPLFGRIRSGVWNCYLWLEDGNGNRSWSSRLRTVFTYDAPYARIAGLRAPWGGGAAYTNSRNLSICWDDPKDPNGTASIWYYFTTSPETPASEPDSSQGGVIAGRIPVSSPCATLPLFRLSGSGNWYCYLWLEDGLGNRDFSTASRTSFVYDINPPLRPALLYRSIPYAQWFGTDKTFRISLRLFNDAQRGFKDASEVRWRFTDAPASGSNFHGRFLIGDSEQDSLSLTIPFDDETYCGDDTLFVWLADSAGNTNVNSPETFLYRFDICSPDIERILPDNVNIAQLAESFNDTLVITDDFSVDTAWVVYRFGGADAQEPARPVVRIGNSNRYLLNLPMAGITKRGVEVRVFATDALGNTGFAPGDGFCEEDDSEPWFPIRTRFMGEGDFRIDADGEAVPLLVSDSARTNYQLFSVPYVAEKQDVMAILEDDLGKYDDTKWRLFDYLTEQGKFVEGDTARPFIPGRSYFLVTRQNGIVVDGGAGLTRRTVCPDTIRLYEGWNLIATPFNFPVSRESLSLINSNGAVTLRSYERGWNIVDVMDPWKGYALYVTSANSNAPIYLVIRPKAAAGRLNKSAGDFWNLQSDEWLVQISANIKDYSDTENWAGVHHLATRGFDGLELAEPPVIGDFVKVSFPQSDWNQRSYDFSTDIRANDTGNQAWEFRVATDVPHEKIRLSFDFLGSFPASAEVYLIDATQRISHNLSSASEYEFTSGASGASRLFKLIVGTREFATAAAGDIALVPTKFALSQNYPNPFNPETTIQYALPEDAVVHLEVFDLLGRRVATLIDREEIHAGYRTVSWNGLTSNGQRAASGVYVYRLKAGGQVFAKKMILLK